LSDLGVAAPTALMLYLAVRNLHELLVVDVPPSARAS
jgi:hypothetical protein